MQMLVINFITCYHTIIVTIIGTNFNLHMLIAFTFSYHLELVLQWVFCAIWVNYTIYDIYFFVPYSICEGPKLDV
jgi:hypothetical protein